jgi:hypothetical protein
MLPPGPGVIADDANSERATLVPSVPSVNREFRLDSKQFVAGHVVYQILPSDPTARFENKLSETFAGKIDIVPVGVIRAKKFVKSLRAITHQIFPAVDMMPLLQFI